MKPALMFGCLSRRVGLYLVAQTYVVIGFLLLCGLLLRGIRSEKPSLEHWKARPTGAVTHAAFSCNSTGALTLETNVLFMSLFGFIFGCCGVSGLVDRDWGQFWLFYAFVSTQYAVWVVSYLLDGLYVLVCGRLPESYWEILKDTVPGRLAFIETMGLEPRTLPPEILDELVGMRTVQTIMLASGLVLLIFPYVLYHCSHQLAWMGSGPTGLGSAFGLRIESEETKTAREVAHGITGAINDLVEDSTLHAPVGNLLRADRYQSALGWEGIDYENDGRESSDDGDAADRELERAHRGYGTFKAGHGGP